MDSDKDGALPSDRAFVPSASSPQAVSPVPASIPSADCVGFTGTQEGCNSNQLAALSAWLDTARQGGFHWMRNGDCTGADEQAGRIWKYAADGKLFIHPPVIRAKRAFLPHDKICLPLPYLERNEEIVDGSAVLIATPAQMSEQRRGGTWYTVRYSRRRKRPLCIIWPDGTFQLENGFAQAIEARRAETQGGSVHESAVPQGCAQSEDPNA